MKTTKVVIVAAIFAAVVFAAACPDKKQANSGANSNNAQINKVTPTPADTVQTGLAMMQSSPGAADAPFDLQFIDSMIAHHEGAIAIAKAVDGKLKHAELNTFAETLIADQEKEIAQLKKWRNQWFTDKPPAVNMDLAGMKYSITRVNLDTLRSAAGNERDIEYIGQTVPYHQGALLLANAAIQKTDKNEIKTLSNSIISEERVDMKQLQDWMSAWLQEN